MNLLDMRYEEYFVIFKILWIRRKDSWRYWRLGKLLDVKLLLFSKRRNRIWTRKRIFLKWLIQFLILYFLNLLIQNWFIWFDNHTFKIFILCSLNNVFIFVRDLLFLFLRFYWTVFNNNLIFLFIKQFLLLMLNILFPIIFQIKLIL